MTPLLVTIAAAAGLSLAGGDFDGRLPDHARWGAFAQVPASPSGTAAPAQLPAHPAPASISTEVMVLHGTNDNSGIDPKIGKIPALSKPPFSSYNSYKLLDGSKVALDKGKITPLKLPTGRELQLTFKDVVQPQKPGEPLRFVVSASIQKADGKSFLPNVEVNAKAGEWFFVGGQEYKGGSLVIGIRVNP
jgi:hypothetical protein